MDGVNNNSAVSKVKVDHTEGLKDDFSLPVQINLNLYS